MPVRCIATRARSAGGGRVTDLGGWQDLEPETWVKHGFSLSTPLAEPEEDLVAKPHSQVMSLFGALVSPSSLPCRNPPLLSPAPDAPDLIPASI